MRCHVAGNGKRYVGVQLDRKDAALEPVLSEVEWIPKLVLDLNDAASENLCTSPRFERDGLQPVPKCRNITGALEAAEKLTHLPFGGSRGLQPPESSQWIQGA